MLVFPRFSLRLGRSKVAAYRSSMDKHKVFCASPFGSLAYFLFPGTREELQGEFMECPPPKRNKGNFQLNKEIRVLEVFGLEPPVFTSKLL